MHSPGRAAPENDLSNTLWCNGIHRSSAVFFRHGFPHDIIQYPLDADLADITVRITWVDTH